ncbi:hypothetical protein JXC34_06485 [Candidatus Woesearchaeota archaeon]|nr:hypothetical protein [Candidatus Woesearchaeota archaeon]
MEKLITEDGSETLRNPDYDEFYHSKSGAVEEAFEKYVRPCRIREMAKKGHLRVLDIGFGLGYNAIAAIDEAMNSNKSCEIEIFSLEKDKTVLEELRSLKPKLQHYGILNGLEYDPANNAYSYEDKNIFLKIKIGNAVDTIKTLSQRFDAVFLDPFSPSKNPELWAVEFLSDVADRMNPGAILATYSYAKKIRQNLEKAGLEVGDGPVVGRRSPSTVAVRK